MLRLREFMGRMALLNHAPFFMGCLTFPIQAVQKARMGGARNRRAEAY
jgi:hypothetical protein